MREFDPQCRRSRKEAVGMEHASGIGKIQNEWKLLARDSKPHSYWKLSGW